MYLGVFDWENLSLLPCDQQIQQVLKEVRYARFVPTWNPSAVRFEFGATGIEDSKQAEKIFMPILKLWEQHEGGKRTHGITAKNVIERRIELAMKKLKLWHTRE